MDENRNKAFVRFKNKPELKEQRRQLRTYGTAAEATLWGMLKNRQIKGLRWRRQFSVGPYILDFYCPEIKLAIELDGKDHFTESGMEHDIERSRYLEQNHNIRVLRFENKMVWKEPETIIADIDRML
ncbi:MAG: DUF559 domain-containing protein [Alistipes sp.]|nr:DUF559 domain-containing protein [Alistipes sp.]